MKRKKTVSELRAEAQAEARTAPMLAAEYAVGLSPTEYVIELLQNTSDFYEDRVTHTVFAKRNRAIWSSIESAGKAPMVAALLRRETNRLRRGG